ncbi:MAG: GntR family transcriptional regulator [Victivallaceae bacterium]
MINLIEKNTGPLFQQMKEQILNVIKESGLKPGDKIPSENQFCFASAVSIRTVRRALAELEKDGVIVRRQGKGSFLRDINAAQPASSGVIGILFSDMRYLSHPIFSKILQSIESHVLEHGYSFHLYSTGNRLKSVQERPLEQIVPLHDIKGLIATSALNQGDILALRRSKTALVAFNEYRNLQLNSVIFDYHAAAAMGIEYLWKCGHEKIAFICRRFSQASNSVILNNDNFLRGIRDTFSSNWKKLDENLIFQTDAKREDGRRLAEQLLKSPNPPDAIFTIDDSLAQGVLDAATENMFNISDRCALITCAGGMGLKGIPRIEIPVDDWSKAAVNLLMKSINGDAAIKKTKVLSPKLSTVDSGNAKVAREILYSTEIY